MGMNRSGRSLPAGPATTPHASSGWSRRACATIASTISRVMVSTPHSLSWRPGLLPTWRRTHRHGGVMTADLVLHGGVVHAVAGPWAGRAATAVAVTGGKIVAVGSDAELRALVGLSTQVVDARGGMIPPGFQDGHAHPPSGGLERMRCDLSGTRDAAGYLKIISEYAAAHPDEPWIEGGGWSMESFPGGCPTAAALDAVVGDRPVYLPNR